MKNIDLTTPLLIFCAVMGMIGTYWWGYYINEKAKIQETYTPAVEKLPEWQAEVNHDKG